MINPKQNGVLQRSTKDRTTQRSEDAEHRVGQNNSHEVGEREAEGVTAPAFRLLREEADGDGNQGEGDDFKEISHLNVDYNIILLLVKRYPAPRVLSFPARRPLRKKRGRTPLKHPASSTF